MSTRRTTSTRQTTTTTSRAASTTSSMVAENTASAAIPSNSVDTETATMTYDVHPTQRTSFYDAKVVDGNQPARIITIVSCVVAAVILIIIVVMLWIRRKNRRLRKQMQQEHASDIEQTPTPLGTTSEFSKKKNKGKLLLSIPSKATNPFRGANTNNMVPPASPNATLCSTLDRGSKCPPSPHQSLHTHQSASTHPSSHSTKCPPVSPTSTFGGRTLPSIRTSFSSIYSYQAHRPNVRQVVVNEAYARLSLEQVQPVKELDMETRMVSDLLPPAPASYLYEDPYARYVQKQKRASVETLVLPLHRDGTDSGF